MTILEQQTVFRSDLLFLFNNLNIFPMNSNGFMRVQVRVQKRYFIEFKFKFDFGKMIEFFRVRVHSPATNNQFRSLYTGTTRRGDATETCSPIIVIIGIFILLSRESDGALYELA